MTSYKSENIAVLFERQAGLRPEAAAAGCGAHRVSYQELNRKSDDIARELENKTMGTCDATGAAGISFFCLDSCIDLTASILGTLKAGGCCLPLSPSWPPGYRNRILRYAEPGSFPVEGGPEKPAVIIHASHTPGIPEGIVLSYRNLRQWITFTLEKLKLDFSRTLVVSSPPVPIGNTFPIWAAGPVSGGYVHFYPVETGCDIPGLIHAVKETGAKSILFPLHVLRDLVREGRYGDFLPGEVCNIVSLGEETFDASEFKVFLKEKNIRWHNFYGFPEMNMVTAVTGDGETGGHTGLPGAGTRAYVLDAAGKLTPAGVKGELYVRGESVMSEYYRNPGLNRSRFATLAVEPLHKLYKTGYRTSLLPDGKITLHGRTDNRFNPGGGRIAAEAIEYLLAGHPSVKDCAVTFKQRPVIHLVLKEEIEFGQIETFLKNELPQEIFPPGFVILSAIPRKENGDIDREYLRDLDLPDNLRIRDLEKEIAAEPGIREVAVIAGERIQKTPPLYVKDFLSPIYIDKTPAGGSVEIPVEAEDDTFPPALIQNPALEPDPGDPVTLGDALERAAALNGEKGILYIHDDGSEHFEDYTRLLHRARRVLAGLRHAGLTAGDKVIFQFHRDEDYIAAFWGCQLGGMVPVPIMAPRSFTEPNSETAMLYNVWETLERPVIFTGSSLEKPLTRLSRFYDFNPSKILTMETVVRRDPDLSRHPGSPDDLALLLFTSGSTGVPKGVMQPHRTILAREKGTIRFNDFNPGDVSMNWMPLEHVGGVVMFHIRDVYCGCSQVQVRTAYILSSPLRWLDIIDKHKVTVTWAPNFAYGLVNEQLDQLKSSGEEKHWDLSSMKFILNGGEAVNAVTVKAFLNRLAPFGLAGDAMKPAWGMSETCSGVVYSHTLTCEPGTGTFHIDKHSLAHRVKESASSGPGIVTFIDLGRTIPGVSVRAVDPQNRVLTEGKVGRLQISGVTVTTGYYKNPDLNREVFTPDGWFDTGDLGFILRGKMTITGRAKDVIIINGINYNNVEIEALVEEVEGVEASYTAACAARDPLGDTETVIIFYSSEYTGGDFNQITRQIKQIERKLVEKMGIKPDLVIPVSREDIPKTSIGKIQRLKLAARFENGEFYDIVKKVELALENENTLPSWFFKPSWRRRTLPVIDAGEVETGSVKNCLVITDGAGLADALVARLEAANCRCFRVNAADYRSKEDYLGYFREITPGIPVRHDIFYLYPYDPYDRYDPHDGGEVPSASEYVLNLLYLIQALEEAYEHPRGLFVVTGFGRFVHETDRVDTRKWGIAGFMKSVSLELSRLRCRHLDFDTAGSPIEIDSHAEKVVREWKSPAHCPEVAYRGNQRFVPCLEPVDMAERAARDIPIQGGGVYIVTGGLGGIGLRVCKWLLGRFQTRLIVVGLTPLPEKDQWADVLKEDTPVSRRLRAFLEIQAMTGGGECMYAAGNISDHAFLRKVKADAHSRWGKQCPVKGVFHLAGYGNLEYHWRVMDDHWVTTETAATFETMFQGKVYGTAALHRLLEDDPDSLFVAFSSTTAYFGAATFSAYAAANSFLDGFCTFRRKNGYPNTFCFNWSSWDNVGMSANNPPHMVRAMLNNGYEMISPKQGLDSLLVALQRDPEQLVVGLDPMNRHIRTYLDQYPSAARSIRVYYTPGDETGFPGSTFRARVLDILSGEGESRNVDTEVELFQLESMPQKPGGGVDYNRLETLGKGARQSGKGLDLPENETEKTLVEIWRQILGKPRIGVLDDFFELGGHSLRATVLAAKIHKEFDIVISIGEIFEYPTVRELAKCIRASKVETYEPIEKVEERSYYPVSSAQKRLYLLQQLNPRNIVYNIPEMFSIKESLDTGKLKVAFGALIARHESLRTSFQIVGGEPVQWIHREEDFEIEEHTAVPADVPGIIKAFIRPFDLTRAPLIRAGLITPAPGADSPRILMMDIHHIVTDGISFEIIFNELRALYAGMELPEPRIQFRDFSEWQNRRAESEKMKEQEEFWLREFAGEIPVLNIPLDFSRPVEQSFDGRTVGVSVDEAEIHTLFDFAATQNASPYMVLSALYNVFLARLSGQEDIVTGTAVSGRQHPDVEPVVGMFVNTLAVRNYPGSDMSFTAFLNRVKEHTLDVFDNQDYPFEDLVEKLPITRDLSRNPLFDALFSFENLEMPSEKIVTRDIPGPELIPYEFDYVISHFDMIFTVSRVDQTPVFKFTYCTRLFKEESIKRFISYFKQLISSIVRDPGRKISELEIMSEADKKQVLFGFNKTSTPYPRDRTIHRLFEEQAEKTPGATALNMSYRTYMTYSELNRRAGQLASLLHEKGVRPDTVVGILVERSFEMIVGLLGILKAGGAYLPIAPDHPEERKKYMLIDSGAALLLTARDINGCRRQTCLFHGPTNTGSGAQSSNSLAYVIYTSGTTGRPKGTLISHSSVTRVVRDTNYIELGPGDRLLQLSNYGFDGAVFDMYGALLNGGALVMLKPENVTAIDKLADVIRAESITVFFVTTALFNTLVDLRIDCFRYTRKVLFGGERASVEHSRKALEYLGANRIVNVYGPTESTVFSTYYFIDRVGESQFTIPIGRPISNTTCYILDKHMAPVPVGIAGQLYIGGEGLSRGYLNNPELTNSKFKITNHKILTPYPLPVTPLYCSGDLARWLPSDARGANNIEFLGRIDQQVKIRGFRIELGEIENLLLKHEDVNEAVVQVLDTQTKDKYLAAYVVPVPRTGIKDDIPKKLRDYLSGKLPDFMVPSFIIPLQKIPLNVNGKVDRKALPAPEFIDSDGYVPPRTPAEEKLAGFWAEILGIEKGSVGIDSDFFRLGGHSLKAAKLIAMVHKEFGVLISMTDIFKGPTIRNLAVYSDGAGKGVYDTLEPVEKKEYYPASSIQKRLFILSELDGAQTAYNLPYAVIVEGDVNHRLFDLIFRVQILRHESLRTSFTLIGGEPVQVVHEHVAFKIVRSEADEREIDHLIDEFITPFDLSRAPLLRAGLIRLSEKKYLFLYDMHHIISDGTSVGIFLRDFMRLYESKGAVDRLPVLRLQYKDFSEWQNDSSGRAGADMARKERYWLDRFSGNLPKLDIFTDFPRPEIQSFEGDRIQFIFESELYQKINRLKNETGTTLYMVLLALYNILLARYTGQEDIIVGTPAAGREHEDFANVIGVFINALPMRNFPRGNRTFRDFLKEVKENTVNAFENQAYPFGSLLEKLGAVEDLSRNPIFETELLVQNIEMPDWEIEGLTFTPHDQRYDVTQVDIALEAWESDEDISFNLTYCTRLFKRVTMEQFAESFREIASFVPENPDIELKDIKIDLGLLSIQSNTYGGRETDFEF